MPLLSPSGLALLPLLLLMVLVLIRAKSVRLRRLLALPAGAVLADRDLVLLVVFAAHEVPPPPPPPPKPKALGGGMSPARWRLKHVITEPREPRQTTTAATRLLLRSRKFRSQAVRQSVRIKRASRMRALSGRVGT